MNQHNAPYLGILPKDPINTGGDHPVYVAYGGQFYGYYSKGYGGAGQWYMLVLNLENSPNPVEKTDGVTAFNGRYFHYGNGSNGRLTVGNNCRK